MVANHYDWENGRAVIQQHSIAKHNVLREYLAAYFRTLVSSPNQEEFRLTLVDGFAGGGHYQHADTGELIEGSPFICLEAAKEAEFQINQSRKKPLIFAVDYFFVEKDRSALNCLKYALNESSYASLLKSGKIKLLLSEFDRECPKIVDFIKKKSPVNGRSIFVLDQYGYKQVPLPLIANIFKTLPTAEVVLTFGVDSFINFASDNDLSQELLAGIGLPKFLKNKSIKEIKSSEKDWRLFIQSALYREIVAQSGAEFYTTFFIRNSRGHGDYWLIHLSQHHRARDVMTEVHWNTQNTFIHYGGAGLNMFAGYDPEHDSEYYKQDVLGFEFDNVAKEKSRQALGEQIPHRIFAREVGMSFEALFASTCNTTPACANDYREALDRLVKANEIEIISPNGTQKRSAINIKNNDQILPHRQKFFRF